MQNNVLKFGNSVVKNTHLFNIGKYCCYYFMIGILLISGITKLFNPSSFTNTLEVFNTRTPSINIFIATILPIIEIFVSIMLLIKIYVKYVLIITSILFFFFFVLSIYGYYIGLTNDCGWDIQQLHPILLHKSQVIAVVLQVWYVQLPPVGTLHVVVQLLLLGTFMWFMLNLT